MLETQIQTCCPALSGIFKTRYSVQDQGENDEKAQSLNSGGWYCWP